MEPLGLTLALRATRRHVLSARPDAPVVAEPAAARRPRAHRAHPVRHGTAALLRRLADRVEPCRPVVQ